MNNQVLEVIRSAFAEGNVFWRTHAQERMLERGISRKDVKLVIERGEIIEAYESDKPFPSYLICGESNGHVIHVVVAWSKDKQLAYVITAYAPDQQHFQADLKTRKQRDSND